MGRRRWAVFSATLVTAVALPAAAMYADTAQVSANAFATSRVEAPTLNSASADTLFCRITLSWTAPATGVAPDGYDILRRVGPTDAFVVVKSVGAVTSTTDTGLSPNTTYRYVVRSKRNNWTSANSNERTATTTLVCV